MTLPASGTIGLLAIRTEFPGQGLPMNLLNYLKPGSFVGAADGAPNVPGAAPLSMSDFYGALHQPPAPGLTTLTAPPYAYTTLPTFSGTGVVGLTISLYGNGSLLGTTTVGAGGTWSMVPTLTDGTTYYGVYATQGNAYTTSPATSPTWNVLYDTYVAPTISLSTYTVTASYSGTNPVTTVTITATVTNGRNVRTPGWTRVSGSTLITVNAINYSTTFSATLTFPQTLNSIWQFTCVDDRGSYVSANLDVTIMR